TGPSKSAPKSQKEKRKAQKAKKIAAKQVTLTKERDQVTEKLDETKAHVASLEDQIKALTLCPAASSPAPAPYMLEQTAVIAAGVILQMQKNGIIALPPKAQTTVARYIPKMPGTFTVFSDFTTAERYETIFLNIISFLPPNYIYYTLDDSDEPSNSDEITGILQLVGIGRSASTFKEAMKFTTIEATLARKQADDPQVKEASDRLAAIAANVDMRNVHDGTQLEDLAWAKVLPSRYFNTQRLAMHNNSRLTPALGAELCKLKRLYHLDVSSTKKTHFSLTHLEQLTYITNSIGERFLVEWEEEQKEITHAQLFMQISDDVCSPFMLQNMEEIGRSVPGLT
ncbi:MAG TPA: hypothetical protein VN457_02260, partial [Chlamydiales bacterium]|nr:hypothetical protein [Chlamydiales bacterium]